MTGARMKINKAARAELQGSELYHVLICDGYQLIDAARRPEPGNL